MFKKDLGLLVLILVVGAAVALINPRFLSPINLSNTANLIGLFGLFSIAEAFVIITGGIELSVGSVIALLGVIFIDLIANVGLHWGLALPLVIGIGVVMGAVHGFLVTRMRLQPFVVTLCGLLIYRGIARYYTDDATAGFAFGVNFPTLEWLTTGRTYGVPHSLIAFVVVALVMAVLLHRTVFGRYLFAVGKNEEAARYSGIRTAARDHRRLCDLHRADRARGGVHRDVHALDLAGLARQFLRALRDRGGGAGRLQPARRRGLDPGRGARHDPASGAAEPGQPARHPELAELRCDRRRDPDRRVGRPAVHALSATPRGPAHEPLRGQPLSEPDRAAVRG